MCNDVYNCPECEAKLSVVQGAPFIHEGVLAYWRRKKCKTCGYLVKTVEVPATALNLFREIPAEKDMV